MRTIKDTTVAVVGGAGFLGSHLVNHLINDRKCRVVVIDNLVVGRREFIHPEATFIHADITQSEIYLNRVFCENRCQFVFNYAADPYIPDSFRRPLHTFATNATGAIQVINAAQEAGCDGILQVSSAEIYGNYETNGQHDGRNQIDEHGEVQPHSTYGASKAAVDYFCQSAWRERRTPVIALRQFNCVGERETHPYVVPEIISQLTKCRQLYASAGLEGDNEDTPIIRLGNNSFRDFLYAGDAVRMAVELLERGQFGEVYNLGSETGVKIYELAEWIGKLMGFESVTVEPDPARVRPWEIWHLQSDNTKIYNVIRTPPLVPLDEALQLTIKDYESNERRWVWES